MNEWIPIVDSEGRRGRFRRTASEPANVEVSLDSGEQLTVPRTSIEQATAGSYRLQHSFASLLSQESGSEREIVVPVVQEELEISKRSVPREHVRLTKTVSQREEQVDVPLFEEHIEVQHVPVGRVVEAASAPRQEGDTWIIPVYEEVLTVEKRLRLREELHVKRTRREVHKPESVTLRREEIEVVRTDPNDKIPTRERGGQQ